MKKVIRIIVFIIVVLVSTYFEIELVLTLTDPWGLKYFDDLATIWDKSVESSNRGYVLPPGTYQFSHWQVTELQNSVRLLPDNASGPCQVLFLGDSVEWGHGVNDKETWVNLIAGQLHQVNAINASFDGYNSENVRRGLAGFPDAKVVVYLINGNDSDPSFGWSNGWPRQPHLSMLDKYVRYFTLARGKPEASIASGIGATVEDADKVRFRDDIQTLANDKRVVLISFEGDFEPAFDAEFNIRVIPHYKNRVSSADAHPNAEGNKELTTSILPLVRDAVAQQCPSNS